MEFSIDGLKNSLQQLNEASEQLQTSFQCDWNDEVHASYEPYVSKCKTATQGIEGVIVSLEKNCSLLNTIHPDMIYQDAENVCAEVNSFS